MSEESSNRSRLIWLLGKISQVFSEWIREYERDWESTRYPDWFDDGTEAASFLRTLGLGPSATRLEDVGLELANREIAFSICHDAFDTDEEYKAWYRREIPWGPKLAESRGEHEFNMRREHWAVLSIARRLVHFLQEIKSNLEDTSSPTPLTKPISGTDNGDTVDSDDGQPVEGPELTSKERTRLKKIPKLNKENGKWANHRKVAGDLIPKVEDAEEAKKLLGLQVDSLRKLRNAGLYGEHKTVGIDTQGRKWRADPSNKRRTWYLSSSLSKT